MGQTSIKTYFEKLKCGCLHVPMTRISGFEILIFLVSIKRHGTSYEITDMNSIYIYDAIHDQLGPYKVPPQRNRRGSSFQWTSSDSMTISLCYFHAINPILRSSNASRPVYSSVFSICLLYLLYWFGSKGIDSRKRKQEN